MAMQEALRLEQPIRGDDRLSMRIVVGLGDIGDLDGEMVGELLALIVRIEAITPADEDLPDTDGAAGPDACRSSDFTC